MTSTTQPINIDLRKYKKKENRRPEKPLNVGHVPSNSSSNGSLPKRYQSVFIKDTPLTSFGIKNDDNNYLRSHSPPNHIQPQIHQRPLKPVKEFLTTHPQLVNQQSDNRQRSSSHTNGLTHSQTEATVQNVNIALTRTFNKLRQEPSHPSTTSVRPIAIRTEPSSARPIIARLTTHQNTGTTTTTSSSNYYYQLPGDTKSPLPAELTTRRPTNLFASNVLPKSTSHNHVSTGTGPFIIQRSTAIRNITKTNDNTNVRSSTPLRAPVKSPETGLDKFNFDNVTLDEHLKNSRTDKNETNQQNIKSRQQFPSPRVLNVDNQHQTLPEVSVNPQIQSSVRQNTDHLPYIHQPIINGETCTNHHHIRVEPTNTFKQISSSIKSQQIVDVQPNVIVQHPRPNSSAKDPFNVAYVERDSARTQVFSVVSTHTNNDHNIASTPEQETMDNPPMLSAPPSSPSGRELNHRRNKQRHRNSIRTSTGALATRRNAKHHRPSGRLENYGDDSDSELTITETQSKEDDIAQRRNAVPSDILSDVWSDLTSEFNETKLRKNPNIRTSTPNITRHSSSLSSKEVGQMRKQLNNLQIMYNDLLKLFDNDIESIRSSIKSNTSSPIDHNGRKHRFRKVVPITSKRQSNLEMKEVNQRFARLESSIVTLAESIAKLSAQVQLQRVMKDDVYQLRQEVAELRQQLSRQQFSVPADGRASSMSTTRLITADVQHLVAVNSTNSISTSYMPPTSIVDPRQARKIEQFFGTEAMLSYFLSLLNYDEYTSVLEHEKIGFYELPFIDERKLQSFGIPYGPCIRIIHEAQQYFISLLILKSNGVYV